MPASGSSCSIPPAGSSPRADRERRLFGTVEAPNGALATLPAGQGRLAGRELAGRADEAAGSVRVSRRRAIV